MKLSVTDLGHHLNKHGLSSCYVLQGDDPYLQQQAQNTLIKAVDSNTEIVRFSVSHASIWDDINTKLQYRSLFAPKQLVLIDMPSIKLPAAAQAYIKQWISVAHPDYTLGFCVGKLNAKDKQTAWLKTLLLSAQEVELIPPNAARMPQWLKQALAQKNISTDAAGLNMLAHYFADNPGAALQEIEKLADYLGERKQIHGEELEHILVAQGQFTVFQLIDSCLGGKKLLTLQIFEALLVDESMLILITWMLAKELRLLVDLSLAITQGDTLTNLAKQHRLWPAKVALYQPLLKHYTYIELWHFLNALAIVDKANKGLGDRPARTQLQYVLQLLASRQQLQLSS